MNELLDLAARCEAASGPDRAIDVAIGLTGRFYVAEPRYPGAEPMIGYVDDNGGRVEPGTSAQDSLVPRYTASLDAAMTLVPEGHGYQLTAKLNLGCADCFVGPWRHEPGAYIYQESGVSHQAATPALALCAAALRARAKVKP